MSEKKEMKEWDKYSSDEDEKDKGGLVRSDPVGKVTGEEDFKKAQDETPEEV